MGICFRKGSCASKMLGLGSDFNQNRYGSKARGDAPNKVRPALGGGPGRCNNIKYLASAAQPFHDSSTDQALRFSPIPGSSSTFDHSSRAAAWAYRPALRVSIQFPVATNPWTSVRP